MTRLQTYAQLVRLPLSASALSNIGLGALAALPLSALPGRVVPFLCLCLSSLCLYCGGMVWNDFFDVAQDRRERPDRPIPSGRVSRREAGLLGGGLLAAGVVFAALAGLAQPAGEGASHYRSVQIAVLIVGAIFAYDAWLKKTWAGPPAMGLCRFLNVLLGVSVAGNLAWPKGGLLALVVGLYVTGVTWFARTEARRSEQSSLIGASIVMLAALVLSLAVGAQAPVGQGSFLFPYLLVALGLWVGQAALAAIRDPSPGKVQAAVGRALMGLIVLDAILASALAGTVGLVLLVLLVPGLYLRRARWLYAT